VLAGLKSRLLPKGPAPRTILFGLFRGIRLRLDFTYQLQIYLGLWERETYRFTRQAVSRSQTCIDIGACRGEYTLLFLSQPSVVQVIAVEPWAANIEHLQDNLALNHRHTDPRLHICTKKLGRSPSPDTQSLDELLPESAGAVFIKIDVDGEELSILESGRQLLSRPGVTLMIETHSPQLEADCLSLLTSLGYKCQIIPNAWWRTFIPENRPIAQNRWLAAERPT
jgi:precorrin-6B methylase 2